MHRPRGGSLSARHPRVFLSYAHEGDVYDSQVLELSQQLRGDGFDCRIDQYDPNPGQGWPRWMVEQIEQADFVLLVCTETYCRRVMGNEVPGIGRGVIWESNLIYQYIYDSGTLNRHFVPLLLSGGEPDHIPAPLRGVTFYRISHPIEADQGYVQLCKYMRGEHRVVPAPLGDRRLDVIDAERSTILVKEAHAGNASVTVNSLRRRLLDLQDPTERYWVYLTLGAIGGQTARASIIDFGLADVDEFARAGAARALQLLDQSQQQQPPSGKPNDIK